MRITWDQKIAMRDGVRLSATIYRDPQRAGRVPAIVLLTPYIAEQAAKRGAYFAQNGYVFVAVDLRGRGNSEGEFRPGRCEAKDGYDTIEWVAAQSWCDGQVATLGGSWLGFTQWAIAKEFPPHLKAIAPAAAVYPGVDFPQAAGVFRPYMLQWLTMVNGRTRNFGLLDASAVWRNAEWELIATGRSFADYEELTGATGTPFQSWLQHPREDAYWQEMAPRPEHYAKIDIPILSITGHNDSDQLGALTYYERHMAYGNEAAKARHWLVIGPWDHGGTLNPKATVGGVDYGPAAVMDLDRLHKEWFDHVLGGGPLPEFLADRVAVFVAGRNAWFHAADFGQIAGVAMRLALDAEHAVVGDVLHGGRLCAEPPSATAALTLISDPGYLPPRDEYEQQGNGYLVDQRDAFALLPNQAMWHSAPLPVETVLAGRARLQLEVAVDQPDSDLFASLYEVMPDGGAVLLGDSQLRLRYRKGGVDAVPMVPGEPELVEFPPMTFVARALAKGSRIRLTVDAGPYLGTQRNTNTGGDLATEPLSKGRIARITVRTGPGTGSAILLPRASDNLLAHRR